MRTFVSALCVAWLLAVPAMGQIIQETGSLRGFLAGSNPGSAYDNWVSHIVEGIADPGYNDYGPELIDPQTSGFGSFRYIPDTPFGDQALDHWDNIFLAMFEDDLSAAAAMVADSAATFHYETVQFEDSDYGRTFYILREQLNMDYVDTSGTSDPADDIYGSFDNGWGVFIFNPNATRANIMVQVVHPCDDFFAPFAAVELFLDIDAAALCINGSGREVLWTGQGSYSNSKSLSDPSRNPRLPLQRYTERFADEFIGYYPHPAFVIQLHSFDPSHDLHTPNILSAGYTHTVPYLPMRDMRQEGRDLAHMTPHPVFAAGDYVGNDGPLPAMPVNDYYAMNTTLNYYVHVGPNDSLRVPQATTLRGDPNNQQDQYLYDESHNYIAFQAIQPFLHVEMDEWPSYLEDNNYPRTNMFNLQVIPPEITTYTPMLEFYAPFLNSIANWLDWWDNPVSVAMPPQIQGLEVHEDGEGSVAISWQPIVDGHQYTYEILADTDPPTENSPIIWTSDDDPWLRAIGLDDWTYVTTLPYQEESYVAVRIRDLGGNYGPLSLPLQVTPDDVTGIELTVLNTDTFPRTGWPLWINAAPQQTDISSITVLWRMNGAAQGTLELEPVGENGLWSVSLPDNVPVQACDLIEYKLQSEDLSATGNPLTYPEDGWYETTISNTSSVFELIDFENTGGEVVPLGEWQIGVPTFGPTGAVSGENVVGTILDGPYTQEVPSFLIINDMLAPEYGPLLLVYEQWLEYAVDPDVPGSAIDGGEIGTDAPGYEKVEPIGGYNYRIPGSGVDNGTDVYSGETGDWETVVVDLRDLHGATANLVFESKTHGDLGKAGWYIDDVRMVREVNFQQPLPFALATPEDGTAMQDEVVTFTWDECVDNDPYAFAEYTLSLTSYNETIEVSGSTDPQLTVDFDDLDLTWNGSPEITWSVMAVSQGDTVYSDQPFTLLNPYSDVNDNDNTLPGEFALREVWPNPFNSTLTLSYDLPKPANVEAILYNVLGQRVAVLENARHIAGSHRMSWRAHGLASGVYLLHLKTGDKAFTRKLVLMK